MTGGERPSTVPPQDSPAGNAEEAASCVVTVIADDGTNTEIGATVSNQDGWMSWT